MLKGNLLLHVSQGLKTKVSSLLDCSAYLSSLIKNCITLLIMRSHRSGEIVL